MCVDWCVVCWCAGCVVSVMRCVGGVFSLVPTAVLSVICVQRDVLSVVLTIECVESVV